MTPESPQRTTPPKKERRPEKNPHTLIPALQIRAIIAPFRRRIHRKALRRGGIGAGRGGRTQDFTAGVRGKWPPSGDGGGRDGVGPAASSRVPTQRRACLCGTQGGGTVPCGVRGFAKTRFARHRWKTAPTGSHGCGTVSLSTCMTPSPRRGTQPFPQIPPSQRGRSRG
jgi:hypothetical protein